MPYKVFKRGKKYCTMVRMGGTWERLKCYDSKKKAEDYKKALYANTHQGK